MDDREVKFELRKTITTNAEILKAFDRYEIVRLSGVTNMIDAENVCNLANITIDQYKFIIKYYSNIRNKRGSVLDSWLYEANNTSSSPNKSYKTERAIRGALHGLVLTGRDLICSAGRETSTKDLLMLSGTYSELIAYWQIKTTDNFNIALESVNPDNTIDYNLVVQNTLEGLISTAIEYLCVGIDAQTDSIKEVYTYLVDYWKLDKTLIDKFNEKTSITKGYTGI